ncbi:PhaM family polyhydroxyalkanoate granule multifunctional regulatory protein [Undibacterium macrobrachii]|uniref:Transcriptional regulator n=1 Tax=Undibacterium macrobrachii TaxID=1119058 RepID=A0ABQ2XH47_9BURK|nr:PhaM family polyhydroxyalkanoate granule multifunctional regulatory protein [Undibacterium macrobrachii]GGX16538.1 hypothetical protein GCM10011282_23700 [Undibacterium macrobrachii]
MQNPFQQTTSGNMHDPLAFVKKLWGDMQLPGMVTPTLSVDELDKQIKDLKTVESWLTVNMNMLKGTIQALEVQRATISALKTMGESFAQAGSRAEATSASNHSNNAAVDEQIKQAWPMHASKYASKTTSSSFNPSGSTAPISEPSVEENEEEEFDIEDEGTTNSSETIETIKASADSPASNEAKPPTENPSSGFHNPAAWWTVLQDQFKQALTHAMKDEDVSPAQTSHEKADKTNAKVKKTTDKVTPTKSPAARATTKKTVTSSPKNASIKTQRKATTKSSSQSKVRPVANVKAAPKAASKTVSKATAKKI